MRKFVTAALLAALTLGSAVAAGASATDIGNAATDRAVVDTYSNFTIVDTNNPAASVGTLNSISYFAEQAGTVRFVLVEADGEVAWVSAPFTLAAGAGTQALTAPYPGVIVGTNLGVYSEGAGVISFDWNGAPAFYTPNNYGLPVVGQIQTQEGTSPRVYSMGANIIPASTPTNDSCKEGGWESFTAAPGPFKNQGQCVSYFARLR